MEMKGSKIIMECLREQGVDTIFGYPGGQIMPLYDALYDYRDEITHVLTSHEQGASHAADGYARSTGKVGVCFATSGPGATNTVTGIATAFMDSIPMVVITGQVPVSLIGRDSFQEVDIVGITLPVTKHNFFVNEISELADTIRSAFKIAMSGRQGPVLVDIPKNIMAEIYEYTAQPAQVPEAAENRYVKDDMDILIDRIARAQRPLIYAGGGIINSGCSDLLTALAEKCDIPVVSTLMNLGAIPRDHRLSLGMVGMHGQREANLAVYNSDLIICTGARFSDRVTGDTSRFAKNAFIVHIDADDSEVDKNVLTQLHLVGDMRTILQELVNRVQPKTHPEWISMVEGFVTEKNVDPAAFIPENIFKVINEVMGDDVIVATDVGQHQMWTAQFWPYREPRKNITSGGLGTMGFGLGAAIGAQMGNPDKRVIHITGDGSFRMNLQELATVSAQKLPITTILFKNNVLGMVRQWQKLFFDERYSATTLPDVIDYIKLAETFGLGGYRVSDLDSLRQALIAARDSGHGNVVTCDIDTNRDVYPMVPPGNAMHDQLLSPDEK